MFEFRVAPWPKVLKIVSLLGTLALLAASYFAGRAVPQDPRHPFATLLGTLVTAVAPVVLVGAALFAVRGYRLEGGALAVQRLLWETRVELEGLTRAWADANAMCKSIRVFGNGGLFSFTGFYRSRALGTYRAFVTDPGRAVVLALPRRRVVVSPAEPAAFLEALRVVCPGAEVGTAAPTPEAS